MENIEQKHECGADDNGCVGHPITNMLMSGAPVELVNDGVQPGDDEHAYLAEVLGADDVPPEFLAGVEAVFEDMAGKVERALVQIEETDARTGRAAKNVARLERSLKDAHAKLDRLLAHLQVA